MTLALPKLYHPSMIRVLDSTTRARWVKHDQLLVEMKQKHSLYVVHTYVSVLPVLFLRPESQYRFWLKSEYPTLHIVTKYQIQVSSVFLLEGLASISGPCQFAQVTVDPQLNRDVTSCHCSD